MPMLPSYRNQSNDLTSICMRAALAFNGLKCLKICGRPPVVLLEFPNVTFNWKK